MMKLFDEIPYLEGERIILRKLTENDREALSEMAQSNNIYRYEPTYLLEQQYTDMDELLRDLYGKYFEQKQNLFLGIYLKENPEELCGLAEFYDFRDHLHMVSIGGRLREKFWKCGIGTEIAKLMSDYLFKETDIEIITASTMVDNKASAHVLEKNGFMTTSNIHKEDWGHAESTDAYRWFL
ncbi:MAG: GNAT family N-acetyltransferase [Clostridia bacterium]|nr:GNAT family N-acetyltransferase [Clostridia bacterium]